MRVGDATFVELHPSEKMDAVDVLTTCLDYEAVNFSQDYYFTTPQQFRFNHICENSLTTISQHLTLNTNSTDIQLNSLNIAVNSHFNI